MSANRAHRFAIANTLYKLLACARQATDKVENALVKEYFMTTGFEALLDPLTQDVFKELVTASQNPSRVVNWEVRPKYKEGALKAQKLRCLSSSCILSVSTQSLVSTWDNQVYAGITQYMQF